MLHNQIIILIIYPLHNNTFIKKEREMKNIIIYGF
jgi:hypothetical protein